MHSPEQSIAKQVTDARQDRSQFQSGLTAEAGLLSLMPAPDTQSRDYRNCVVNGVEIGPDGKPVIPDDQKGFGLRDQTALASLFFCSPLMLLGMGAAMSTYEGFNSHRTEQLLARGRFTRGSGNLYAPGYSKDAREKADEKFNHLVSRRPMSSYSEAGFGVKAAEKKVARDKIAFSQSRVAHAETRFRDKQAKDMLTARRIVKEKTRLEADIERVKQTQNYSLVCQLSSRMEMLDKTLKRMGM